MTYLDCEVDMRDINGILFCDRLGQGLQVVSVGLGIDHLLYVVDKPRHTDRI